MHPRNESTNRFPLFEKLVDDIENKTILDFGGNRGNLLYFSKEKIKQENYTCIDVEKDAIESGKNEFLNASFIHYNRFSPMYNNGSKSAPFPKLDKQFDIGFAYSVVTHTNFNDFKNIFYYLKNCCKKVIVSFIDITDERAKQFFYNKRVKDFGSCINFMDVNNSKYFYLVNNDKIIINNDDYNEYCKFFITFYNKSFLLSFFKDTYIIDTTTYQSFLIFNNE